MSRTLLLIAACFPDCLRATDGIACMAEMELPNYPPLARQAKQYGEVHAELASGRSGGVKVSLRPGGAPKLLKQEVLRVLSHSSIDGSCKESVVRLTFIFAIEEQWSRSDVERTVIKSPNIVMVIARAFPLTGQDRTARPLLLRSEVASDSGDTP